MSPPGGEKDETPPELINTIPDNKATNYDGNTVELFFPNILRKLLLKMQLASSCTKYEPNIIYKGKNCN